MQRYNCIRCGEKTWRMIKAPAQLRNFKYGHCTSCKRTFAYVPAQWITVDTPPDWVTEQLTEEGTA